MATREAAQHGLTRYIERHLQRDIEYGYLGVVEDGAYVFDITNGTGDLIKPGYIQCRIEAGLSFEPSECIPRVALDPYTRCMFQRVNGVLEAVKFVAQDAVRNYGAQAAGLGVPSLPMADRGGAGDLTPTDGNILLADGTKFSSVPLDASIVAYTPAVGGDPGNTDDALDDLRSRVTTLEGGGGGGTISANGWVSAGETWTYASADDPTYTLTITGDLTGKYSPGMRVCVSQSTGGTKYFLITAASYSAPNTTLTLYGGTDYDLANETISSPNFSPVKAPFGFPLDPTKWTVEVSDTTNRSQGSPVTNTWYNLGSISISIPIGIWETEYEVYADHTPSSNPNDGTLQVTLSTANNSESDSQWTAQTRIAPITYHETSLYRRKVLVLSSKASYYLNTRATTSASTIANINSLSTLIIRARSAYL